MTIWRVIDPWFPLLHVWRLERSLKAVPPVNEDIDRLVKRLSGGSDRGLAAAAAESIAVEETSRIDRLEAKLDSQRTVITALSPFAIGLLGSAIAVRSVPVLVLGLLAAIYLIASFLVSMRGGAASERFILSASRFDKVLASRRQIGVRTVATRIVYARANENYGTRLANYIAATQRSTLIAALLTGIGAALLLTGH